MGPGQLKGHHHVDGWLCTGPLSKAQCDEVWTQFEHGHAGRPCIKDFQPSKSKRGEANKLATCTIIDRSDVGLSFEGQLRRQGLT